VLIVVLMVAIAGVLLFAHDATTPEPPFTGWTRTAMIRTYTVCARKVEPLASPVTDLNNSA
jgi:hypothetical protein